MDEATATDPGSVANPGSVLNLLAVTNSCAVACPLRQDVAALQTWLAAECNAASMPQPGEPAIAELVRSMAGLVHTAAAQSAALQAEADDMRMALRVARIGMWRVDVATGTLEWSRELHTLFGTDPATYRPSREGFMLLVHPDDRETLHSSQARALAGETVSYEFRLTIMDGTTCWRRTDLRVDWDAAGTPTVMWGVVRDVTERRRATEHIHHLAHYDVLTGLANRVKLATSLRQHLGRAKRMQSPLAVLALDLDGLKAVNDLLGHAAGDKLLQTVALRLRANVREGDTVARLGGDEFIVIQGEAAQPEGALHLAERLVEVLAEPIADLGSGAAITVSVGVALYPDDVPGITDLRAAGAALLAAADTALYRVKRSGRNGHAFFQPGMDGQQKDRRALEHDLRQALGRGELSLAYQPQAAAGTGEVLGFEALLRWTHPTRGNVSPDVFIKVAEETGCILPIGAWVLHEACREAASWAVPLRIAVNVSALQVHQADLAGLVAEALATTGLDATRLELEVTESVLLADGSGSGTSAEMVIAALHRVRALGVRLAMDDFGTGYSSLASLRAFPFDKIKLDRGFVADLGMSEGADAIVRAVLGLGRGLNMPVVAEGVETLSQAAALKHGGCDELQGYLIGRPLPIGSYTALTSRTPAAAMV